MLYLLTYADMRAVGPGVLTPWQARILHELYARTLASLTGGRVARPSRTRLPEPVHAAAKGGGGPPAGEAPPAMVNHPHLQAPSAQPVAQPPRVLHRPRQAPVGAAP